MFNNNKAILYTKKKKRINDVIVMNSLLLSFLWQIGHEFQSKVSDTLTDGSTPWTEIDTTQRRFGAARGQR